jgi:transcriptional regulator with XRE-family HTH domain
MASAIGDLLRELRAERGISQEDLAEAIGYSQESVSGWERGLFTPRPRALRRIAHYLGVPEAELLIAASWARTAAEARRIAEADEPAYDARDPRRELAALLPRLADHQVRALIVVARELLQEKGEGEPEPAARAERNGA